MPAIAYVNGRYGPIDEAAVSVEDRGFQFADSIYEVVAFLNGRFLDFDGHIERLRRGLAALFIDGVPSDAALGAIAQRLLHQSRYADGLLYVQISRGAARRDHAFPAGIRPTLVMTVRRFDFRQRVGQLARGIAVMTLPDQRWARCDLKTTGLLPAVLAKQEAREGGAFEALFVRGDDITEGASTNVYMVDSKGRLITHPVSASILAGIARGQLLRQARQAQIEVIERPFTQAEAQAASELLVTSTTVPLLPVVTIDGKPVGNGAPGPIATRLGQLVWAEVERQTGWQP